MVLHKHPYQPFIPKNSTKLIVGTLPPPRFSTGELLEGDVNFSYGSRDGQLWPILDRIFKLDLKYENSQFAISQRKEFLIRQNIGICDIVESCKREKMDALDLGMQEVQLRNLLAHLKLHSSVETLLFTGGNSKNGPEYFFRKLLKEQHMKLEIISSDVPRIHQFKLGNRFIRSISLTAPSGSANRAVGRNELYKLYKKQNPNFTTIDFRIMQYKKFFEN